MNMAGPIRFMNFEENFLLASLKEFVTVWSSGNQASFNVDCNNGKAWLHLAFQLGRPEAAHHHSPLPCHQRRYPRSKGPARRNRDRLRAQKHQAGLQSAQHAAASATSSPPAAVSASCSTSPPPAASASHPPPTSAAPKSPPPTHAASASLPPLPTTTSASFPPSSSTNTSRYTPQGSADPAFRPPHPFIRPAAVQQTRQVVKQTAQAAAVAWPRPSPSLAAARPRPHPPLRSTTAPSQQPTPVLDVLCPDQEYERELVMSDQREKERQENVRSCLEMIDRALNYNNYNYNI